MPSAEPETSATYENAKKTPSLSIGRAVKKAFLKNHPLLFARGFLLTERPNPATPAHWTQARIGAYMLAYDPRNSFYHAVSGGRWAALLGTALDTQTWTLDGGQIVRDALKQLTGGENALFEHLDGLCGRFVLAYGMDGRTCLLTDACGVRSTFYADLPHALAVGSHALLVRKCVSAGPVRAIDPAWLGLFGNFLPGHYTPYEGIYFLTPNTLLELETRTVRRFFPRGALAEKTVNDALNEVSELLIDQLELLARERRLAMSLSGGLDSRTTLAFTRRVTDRILYFTYHDDENESQDRGMVLQTDQSLATEIAANLGLKHRLLKLDYKANPVGLTAIQHANSFLRHNHATACAFLANFPPDMLHLSSNLAEIGRAFYRKASFHELPLTPERMAKAYNLKAADNPGVIAAFGAYAERTSLQELYNYDPYDIFYWEHRMGVWHSCIALEHDLIFDTFIIYNCRRVLNLLLAVPVEERINGTMYHELIRRQWPVLEFWPINRRRVLTGLFDHKWEEPLLEMRQAEVRGGSIYDSDATVPVETKRTAYSLRFHIKRTDPQLGDFAAVRVLLHHTPHTGQCV